MVRYQGEEGEGNLIFCCKGSRENHGHGELSFWLVAKIMIIILRFWVGTSKKKKIIIESKKLVLSCQHNVHKKPITSIYPVIQQCQIY